MCHHPDCQSRNGHSPHGIISGHDLASVGFSSDPQGCANQMGIDPIARRAVFLDRDGVINRAIVRGGKPYPPVTPTELEILPGVPQALAALKRAGFRLIVITNQPDVARGRQTKARVEEINQALLGAELPLDAFRVCYHDDADGCDCRKPLPGLVLSAAREEGLDLTASFVVGDRWRDIEAGRQAGCRTILIDYGYAESLVSEPDARVQSLVEAAEWILARVTGDGGTI